VIRRSVRAPGVSGNDLREVDKVVVDESLADVVVRLSSILDRQSDVGVEQVSCTSAEVLALGTGICFPKPHLVASMMRCVGIPCGFCYQVFKHSPEATSQNLTLHGLNAIYPNTTSAWHRIDPRGNRTEINMAFSTDADALAFPEMRFLNDCIYAEPLDIVVNGLRNAESITDLWANLLSASIRENR
jgi:hypothetical protein